MGFWIELAIWRAQPYKQMPARKTTADVVSPGRPPVAKRPKHDVPDPLAFADVIMNDESFRINAEIHAEVRSNFMVRMDHPVFEDIHMADPLPIQSLSNNDEGSGHQAPMGPDEAETALKETGSYKAAGNICWADLLWSATGSVPLKNPLSTC